MTSKVWQVSVDETAEATLALMRHKSVSSVLVTEGETILGIITERDIARLCSERTHPERLTLSETM